MRSIALIIFFILPSQILTATCYFQQTVNYAIAVNLDDVHHELHGNISIEYINNSPDTLNEIYMHLWPNAYKNNETALAKQLYESRQLNFYYAPEEERGYIDSLNFKVGGKKVTWMYHPEHIDIGIILLNEPLLPGKKTIISTPFHVKIPKGVFSRLGHIGQQYQITQWYPKPAVYDMYGWHPMPYLNQGEFYSEFGIYDVLITVPQNYVVGSTGDLKAAYYSNKINVNYREEEEAWLMSKVLYTKDYLKSRKNAGQDLLKKKMKFEISLGNSSRDEDIEKIKFPPSDSVTKTLHFHQEKVHDFAWFADKRYLVLKGEVTLPHSGKTVTTWSMFTEDYAKYWQYSIRYINDAIYYYSLWNGDYPYRHATAVDGALSAGGGMEYPNITVIGGVSDTFPLEMVIMHEVGHNWFYGILGSNERDHAWMDEGINSFNELRYRYTKYPDRKLFEGTGRARKLISRFNLSHFSQKTQYELFYLINARRNLDQPIDFPSAKYSMVNYGGIVYSKTAVVFDYLKAYLGDAVFDTCMKRYYSNWKFRHPYPADLQNIFTSFTEKELSWFFGDLIKTTGKIDYKISSVKYSGRDNPVLSVKIKNMGDISSPFSLSAFLNDSLIATGWHEGFEGAHTITTGFPVHPGNIDKIKIDANGDIPETNRRNNTSRTNGIFRKIEPLKLQHSISLENPGKTQIFWEVASGWNNYDKMMIGAAIYSGLVPYRPFEYVFIPMYGIGSKKLTGTGKIGYTFFPDDSLLKNVHLGISGRKYSYFNFRENELGYLKIAPTLQADFRNKNPRSKTTFSFNYRFIFIRKERMIFDSVANEIFITYKNPEQYGIHDLYLNLTNTDPVHPYKINFRMEDEETFLKLSAGASFSWNPKRKWKGFSVRFFTGLFLLNQTVSSPFGFSMDGGNDYLFDEVYFGRTETGEWMSQQAAETDGAFKAQTGISLSDKMLTALNLKISTVRKFPVKIFADFGYTPELGTVAWDAGIDISLIPEMLEVYLPLYVSRLSPYSKIRYPQAIRFTFNIGRIDPHKIARSIEL
ncbi:MAG: hypothetical protein HYY40_00380 [Bacteroidetes bacterium]|nr:hypothetical protein [Bacteroidota bacterium]